jgi:hypothetical protein
MKLLRRKKTEILEEKAEFAESIKQIWVHGNYEKIKEAHNEILTFLKEKEFDFFSVQYLLTMTYMELLINEYMESHNEEIMGKLKKLMGGEK